MRIRTILAAVAAPAALAGVLLGTAGQASAAVAQPTQAALTTSVKQLTYSANAHQHDVADTTFGNVADLPGSVTQPSDGGPIWAHDNLERKLTATDAGVEQNTGRHIYDVLVSSQGSYSAFASPIDGKPFNGNGPVSGWVKFTVYSATPPSGANLPAQLGPDDHSSSLVQKWFGAAGTVTGGDQYHFEYKGIPGAPGGVYVQP
jgi:hypothetical protein